jgi:hypothetical protein
VSIGSMTLDTGSSATDFITNDGGANRTVSGTLSSGLLTGESVEVSFDGGTTWTTATPSGTSWSATDPGTHSGDWTIVARVTNGAAGVSGPEASQSVTLDTTLPSVPTVTGSTTSDTTPTITGTAALGAGEVLTVTVGGTTYTVGDGHLTRDSGTGAWSLTVPAGSELTAGTTYAVTATVTDVAGNVRSDTTTNELSVAQVTPEPPEPLQDPVLPAIPPGTVVGPDVSRFVEFTFDPRNTVSGMVVTLSTEVEYHGDLVQSAIYEARETTLREGRTNDLMAGQYGLGAGREIIRPTVAEASELADRSRQLLTDELSRQTLGELFPEKAGDARNAATGQESEWTALLDGMSRVLRQAPEAPVRGDVPFTALLSRMRGRGTVAPKIKSTGDFS